VFTSELNKELSTLIWQLVNGMLRQKLPNFNSEISEFSRLKDPKNSEIYRDLAGVLDSVLESENPTYNQVLDLLIYKGKKTVNSKAPTFHYSSGKMKLGDKVYNAAEWNDSKEEVIEYLMANKRTHVNAKYMNSKTQNAYNTFLAKHNLVFTNAFTNSSTRSPFVQPTLRFAPIGAKKEERAPLAAPSPMVKPEAPVAKKESTKPNKPTSPSSSEGLQSYTMADLPADMQAEAMEALAAFEAGEVRDISQDKELIDAGLGAIVPVSSHVTNILKNKATPITGKELEKLLIETSEQGKLELNLEQEDGTAPSDNTVDWGEDTNWMLDTTEGMDLDNNLDITKQQIECD